MGTAGKGQWVLDYGEGDSGEGLSRDGMDGMAGGGTVGMGWHGGGQMGQEGGGWWGQDGGNRTVGGRQQDWDVGDGNSRDGPGRAGLVAAEQPGGASRDEPSCPAVTHGKILPLPTASRQPSPGFFLPQGRVQAGPGLQAGPEPPFLCLSQLQFPLPEFILAMGFFLVLVLEQVALAQREASSIPEETRALLPTGSIQTLSPQPPVPGTRSAIRAGLLVLALALHAVLEGLALGLQEAEGAVLRVCLALVLHKCAVAFSLALKLLRGRLRPPAVVACLTLFAMMSPLGVGLGTAVAAGAGPRQRLCRGVLEGLAAGTFLYITFLEILPQELGVPQHRIPKVILLLAGFALVTAILFIKI